MRDSSLCSLVVSSKSFRQVWMPALLTNVNLGHLYLAPFFQLLQREPSVGQHVRSLILYPSFDDHEQITAFLRLIKVAESSAALQTPQHPFLHQLAMVFSTPQRDFLRPTEAEITTLDGISARIEDAYKWLMNVRTLILAALPNLITFETKGPNDWFLDLPQQALAPPTLQKLKSIDLKRGVNSVDASSEKWDLDPSIPSFPSTCISLHLNGQAESGLL